MLRSAREASSLASGGRTQVAARHAVQWLLVGVQMALAVTLLAGAGLLLRSVEALSRVDPGFDPERVLAFRLSANWIEEEDRHRLVQRIEGTLDEIGALPGVESVATAWSLPGVPRQYQVEFDLVEGGAESAAPLLAPWFLARTQGDPSGLAGAVRLKLKDLEPLRSVYDIAPLEQRIGDAYEQNRLRTLLPTLFAATALFLACLGLYETLSYVVSLRRREVGLRLALGALRGEIIRQLVGPGKACE